MTRPNWLNLLVGLGLLTLLLWLLWWLDNERPPCDPTAQTIWCGVRP